MGKLHSFASAIILVSVAAVLLRMIGYEVLTEEDKRQLREDLLSKDTPEDANCMEFNASLLCTMLLCSERVWL